MVRDRALGAGSAALNVSFAEWSVPTKGSHPHDPLAAADGSIWYTGQMASTLGRVDPKTGVFKEYRTKTPASGPHGLVADDAGNIWFTANFAGYIGRLDPTTGASSSIICPTMLAIRIRRCSIGRVIFGSRS
jgi:virginiamycin B lyase